MESLANGDAQPGPAAPPAVALLVESSTSWGTGIIRGIAQYAAAHGPWVFYLEPFGRSERLRMPEGWVGDGVIARMNNPELVEDLVQAGIPAVDVSWFSYSNGRFPRCTTDERAVGRMATAHLLERGFRQLAYIPPLNRPGYENQLGAVITSEAARAGCECRWFERPPGEHAARSREAERRELIAWLRGLPKPVGVVAFGDFSARMVTECCWLAGLSVPDEVAVVGSEQDELSAIISNPPLSSIDIGPVSVGIGAARVLHSMMQGRPAPSEPVLIPPVGVITRRSTDILSTDDELVNEACRFMRARSHTHLNVEHVVDHCAVSRRTLEQRFASVLERTPAQMLRKIRVERACTRLTDSDDSLPVVAELTGFGSVDRMTRAFLAEVEQFPQEYRDKHKPPRR